MTDLVRAVNVIRDVPHSRLARSIKKVAVILSGPRSGSSLVKGVLSAHRDIASLDGEIEPFLALTRNGFSYNSDSDAIGVLSNKRELIDNLFDELTVHSDDFPAPDVFKKRWEKRLLLQFPSLFSKKARYRRLVRSLDEALTKIYARPTRDEKNMQSLVLSRVFRNEPWRTNYYDGHLGSNAGYFNESVKIEEPPFIVPRIYRKSFARGDAEIKTLLFKSPPDVYRIGMYEQLFPNADVKYIHLTRGYAQSVNGLMDGWLSPVGFFSHNLGRIGKRLSIGGYSDSVAFGGDWWKFDLPPNWREFTDANLEEVCLNQWLSAHGAILSSGVRVLRISFEEFLSSPSVALKKITDYLGIQEIGVPKVFPVIMAVEPPIARRWKIREHKLLKMSQRRTVRAMMGALGYEMNPRTWI